MARMFVAAWPSADVRAALHELPAVNEPGVRRVPPQNWHVTLRFVGDADPDELIALLGHARPPRAVARLGPAVDRLDARQVVVPVAGVDELAAAVRDATREIGEIDRRPFRGHLTVARTKRGARTALVGVPFDATFTVDEIAIVGSELAPTGAVYTTLASLPTDPA